MMEWTEAKRARRKDEEERAAVNRERSEDEEWEKALRGYSDGIKAETKAELEESLKQLEDKIDKTLEINLKILNLRQSDNSLYILAVVLSIGALFISVIALMG